MEESIVDNLAEALSAYDGAENSRDYQSRARHIIGWLQLEGCIIVDQWLRVTNSTDNNLYIGRRVK